MAEEPSADPQAQAVRQDDNLVAIERASTGDGDAFEMLVPKHQTWVFSLAYRMLGDHAEAEEMAQEIFLKVPRAETIRAEVKVLNVTLQYRHESLSEPVGVAPAPPAPLTG